MKHQISNTLKTLLAIIEPIIIVLTVAAFWHHSPPIRDNWVWLLGLALPIFGLRLVLYQRLWTRSPLDILLVLFVLLTAFNYESAPYSRRDYLVLVCRPLLGIWIYLYMLEHVRQWKTQKALLYATIGMSLVLALLALTASQWQYSKLVPLDDLARALPAVDYDTLLPTFWFSFNPNEIAGALSYMTPVMAGLAIAPVRHSDRAWQSMRLLAGVAFVLLFVAVFLGQSRFAIAGTLGALIVIIWLLIPHSLWRYLALGAVACVILLQAALLFNWLDTSNSGNGLSNRDERTFSTRLDLWQRGFQMMLDYPLTGAGMSMYRTAVQEERYSIPYYEDRRFPPPHAHNEWAQIAADLGLPGLLIFLGWQAVTAYMLIIGWLKGRPALCVVAVAVAGGLLAHGFYALGDAVTLWDRYSFIFWWLLGLAGSQYLLHRQFAEKQQN